MTMAQKKPDPIVQSICQEYLGNEHNKNNTSKHQQQQRRQGRTDEEDIVLAAMAVLERDDLEARGLWLPKQEKEQQVQSAAMVGALAGMVLGGPVMGALAAGGVALAAAKNRGAAGEMARASGDALWNVGEQLLAQPAHLIVKNLQFFSKEGEGGC